MKHLEQTIARFLDGEMSTDEEIRFRRELRSSVDARELLREMTLLRREARRLPILHAPSAQTETELFERLAVEGFSARARLERRRRRVIVFSSTLALILFLVIGWELLPERIGQGSIAWAQLSPSFPVSIGGAEGAVASVQAIDRRHVRIGNSQRRSIVRTNGLSYALHQPGAPAPRENVLASDHGSPSLAFRDSAAEGVGAHAASLLTSTSVDSGAPIVDPPGIAPKEPETSGWRLVASVQGGGSRMNRADGLVITDAQVRVGVEAWDGGRLSLVAGVYPSVTELKHANTTFALSSPAGIKRESSDTPPPAHRVILEDEVWGGVALRQRIARFGTIEVEAGGSVGASKSALHFSEEVLLGHRVTTVISLEAGITLSHMIPYDQSVEQFQVFDSPDRFVYNGVRQQPAFSSVGCQVGVRVVLDALR